MPTSSDHAPPTRRRSFDDLADLVEDLGFSLMLFSEQPSR